MYLDAVREHLMEDIKADVTVAGDGGVTYHPRTRSAETTFLKHRRNQEGLEGVESVREQTRKFTHMASIGGSLAGCPTSQAVRDISGNRLI